MENKPALNANFVNTAREWDDGDPNLCWNSSRR
jgi:hypothetical protein